MTGPPVRPPVRPAVPRTGTNRQVLSHLSVRPLKGDVHTGGQTATDLSASERTGSTIQETNQDQPSNRPMTTEFNLTLRPTPDPSDPSGYRRLRKALKVLLRSFGLRCVDVTERAESLETDTEPGKVSDR